ncbi:MAG: hypothetical protein EPN82_14690 [Bacteroidetes bacterium]|nr:MAG: hypothetical protein EPN82_14690 [Bacteroidota bacterium]
MDKKNHYKAYLEEQLKDSEFAAHYALSREKIKLEIFLEKLKEQINQDAGKPVLIRNLNKITKYVKQIAL